MLYLLCEIERESHRPMWVERFIELTALLGREEALWRQRPFVQVPVPWEAKRPRLADALRSLHPQEIAAFESAPTEIPAVRAAEPSLAAEIERLTEWPMLRGSKGEPTGRPAGPRRVSHRKWVQVHYFTQVIGAALCGDVRRFVDWCSGKGHLGSRLGHAFGLPVTCVEKNPSLCEAGRREAAQAGVFPDFACLDVLLDEGEAVLDAGTAAVALHACGHLNVALMKKCVDKKVPFLAIAPCCYQRIDGMQYVPLSETGRRYSLPLTRHELRLPSLDETMTTDAKRALRRKEHAFRLGVDLLHRAASGVDCYRPLGAVRPGWLKRDFAYFAKRIATEKNIPLPEGVNWARAEQDGWDRFHEASALGLARGLFRRALESRLILDRALFLQENGYTVQIGTFCPRDITPRNLMIIAHRGG